MKDDVVREVERIRVHLGLKEPAQLRERIEYFYKYLNSDRELEMLWLWDWYWFLESFFQHLSEINYSYEFN